MDESPIPPAPGADRETTIILHSARRERAQMVNHATTGFVLLAEAVGAVIDQQGFLLPLLSFLAGGALMLSIARGLRRHAGNSGVSWVDLFGGTVLLVEALNKAHNGKKVLPFAYGLLALATILLGIFHDTLARGRYVRLDERAVTARPSPWRKVSVAWADIRSMGFAGARIEVVRKAGTRSVVDLHRADNREEAIAAVKRYARMMNVGLQEHQA